MTFTDKLQLALAILGALASLSITPPAVRLWRNLAGFALLTVWLVAHAVELVRRRRRR